MGHDADAFWRQTPRVIGAVLDGDLVRLKRERADAAVAAQRAGMFAQIEVKSHERALKTMLAEKRPMPHMSGKQIGGVMRALAARRR